MLGNMLEKDEIKRGIKGDRFWLLHFCKEGEVKMPTKSNSAGDFVKLTFVLIKTII